MIPQMPEQREMVLQLNKPQFKAALSELWTLLKSRNIRVFPNREYDFKDIEKDEKKRLEFFAVWKALQLAIQKGLAVNDITTVICWRDENGQPNRIAINTKLSRN